MPTQLVKVGCRTRPIAERLSQPHRFVSTAQVDGERFEYKPALKRFVRVRYVTTLPQCGLRGKICGAKAGEPHEDYEFEGIVGNEFRLTERLLGPCGEPQGDNHVSDIGKFFLDTAQKICINRAWFLV